MGSRRFGGKIWEQRYFLAFTNGILHLAKKLYSILGNRGKGTREELNFLHTLKVFCCLSLNIKEM
jgi:hypothetical protein